ncbi:MAG TPA: hypothetical protein DF699_10605 [Phycisphaerales bacterium]|nr:hypothetical protein [Phycisphaerales bacterium]
MTILLVYAGSTCAMMGLIWFIQIVHYPLMARVGAQDYALYQHAHMSRTTFVVAPLMLIEMATAILLLWLLGPDSYLLTIAGLVMLVLIWISTAALQVPAHKGLTQGFAQRAHRRLVATNWVRTILWSLRAILACVLIVMN